MVAVARLITHAIVCTAGTKATIEFFVFEEELWCMDTGTFHLIIYIRAGEDMVYALPLALIAISASDPILSLCLFRKITNTMLADLLEDRTIRPIVEITGNQYLSIG